MIVKLRNGEKFVYNTDEIEEVFFEKNEFDEEGILDVQDSPLKFEITSDSTVKVIRDVSYESFTEVDIPCRVRIDDKIYSVTGIGRLAFAYAVDLSNVKLPSTLTTIDYGAFKNCYDLNSIEIPESVTHLGSSVFAFSKLESVNIPSAITSISDSLFIGCNLSNFRIPYSITSIGKYAFAYNKRNFTSIEIPSSVQDIGEYAFKGTYYLKSVVLSSNITQIKEGVFYDCAITNITIPASVKSIGKNAFCVADLEEIDIPSNVVCIGDSAFGFCALTRVSISDSIAFIGNGAFCFNEFTSIDIPSSVTNISPSAFRSCDELVSISVAAENPNYSSYGGVLYNKNATKVIIVPEGLKSVTLPSSVTCTPVRSWEHLGIHAPGQHVSFENRAFAKAGKRNHPYTGRGTIQGQGFPQLNLYP